MNNRSPLGSGSCVVTVDVLPAADPGRHGGASMSYDPDVVLANVSDHAVLALVLGGLALVSNFVFFTETARLAARHRRAPLALLGVAVFLPHDLNYVLNAGDWFGRYSHWFCQLFWVALIATSAFEVLFLVQIVRFGRAELAPGLSQAQFTAVCLAAVVLGAGAWGLVKSAIDDPLYLISFLVTATLCVPAGASVLLRRPDRGGQSRRQWLAFCGIPAGYLPLSLVVFGDAFDDVLWIFLSVATLLGGFMLVWAVRPRAARADRGHRSPRGDAPTSPRRSRATAAGPAG